MSENWLPRTPAHSSLRPSGPVWVTADSALAANVCSWSGITGKVLRMDSGVEAPLGYYRLGGNSEKFVKIKIHNLINSGNIKKSILFISVFLSEFALLITKLRTINKKRSFKYKFISPYIFFILILYKLLISISSNEYYSIEAIKK